MNNIYKCAFTGHRVIKVTDALKERLRGELVNLIKDGTCVFINGGALGFDLFCASEIIKLKNEYPIKLKMMLPCKDQSEKWTADQKMMYDEILYNADEIEYISDKYTPGCMQIRNRKMVDECDVLISYCTRSFGGTFFTVNYANKTGKKVINVNE